jgi:cytochrome b6-f complex iron-sulfur subunit
MPEKVTRRDFIKSSALGVVAGGIAFSGLDLRTLAAKSQYARTLKIGDEVIIKLSDTKNKDLENVGGSVLLDDDNILIRISETEFKAINLICKHKGCTVEYEGTKFVCPCHGSEYDRDGKVTLGPSKSDLDTHETIYDAAAGTVTVKMKKPE